MKQSLLQKVISLFRVSGSKELEENQFDFYRESIQKCDMPLVSDYENAARRAIVAYIRNVAEMLPTDYTSNVPDYLYKLASNIDQAFGIDYDKERSTD